MSKTKTKEDTQFYKSMTLTSSSVTVEVNEKADRSYTDSQGVYKEQIEPARVRIYHSPRQWDENQRCIVLKDRADLKDYITMLVDFEKRFGDLLDDVQTPEKIDQGNENE